MNFNINKLQLSDTTILHLLDPATNAPLYSDAEETKPLQIEMFGRSSSVYRKWQAEALRKSNLRKNKELTADQSRETTAEFLATISKSASNFDMDGEPINSYEAFKKLYSNPKLFWIGDQVAATLSELDAFLGK
jgi:hypothetical protein